MTREDIETQIQTTTAELEQAKAQAYRCDGALQVLRHLLKTFDAPKDDPPAEQEE